MKLSLSGRILQGGGPMMSTPDFIHLARDTGFHLVELRPDQAPLDATDADLAVRPLWLSPGVHIKWVPARTPAAVSADESRAAIDCDLSGRLREGA